MTRFLTVGSKDEHLRKESHAQENRFRSFAVPLRRHWIVILGSLLVPVESLRKGADTYYDFLNIKWVMGWKLSHGDLNLKGIASTRKWAPPYLDVWNSIWASAGPWWLPNIVHGLAHLLIVPSVFILARRVAPHLPNLIHQLLAVTAVSVPLVRMQIGTSTGHLYAALPIIWSLTLLLGASPCRRDADVMSPAQPLVRANPLPSATRIDPWVRNFLAGGMLALSPLLKPSALSTVPAHLVAVTLLVSSLSGVIAFGYGFATVYLVGAIGWAVCVATVTTGSPLAVMSPGIPVSGPALVLLSLLVVCVGLASFIRPRSRTVIPTRVDSSGSALAALTLVLLCVAYAASAYLRRAAYDVRWLVPDLESMGGRLFHAGDLKFGYLTVDLESAYFDTSIPMSVVLLAGVLLIAPIAFRKSTSVGHRRAIGAVVFIALPLVSNMWATGYTRYASQVVPLVGVAGIAFFTLTGSRVLKLFGSLVVVTMLCFPMFLTDRASAEVPRFGQVAYDEPIYEDFVSQSEVDELNELLPEGATVLAVGAINTYLLPQLGRTDLDWWFWEPNREEVAKMSGDIIFMFNPGNSDLLGEYVEQGLLYDECSVLRFRRTSVGLCIGRVDPEVRSSARRSNQSKPT